MAAINNAFISYRRGTGYAWATMLSDALVYPSEDDRGSATTVVPGQTPIVESRSNDG